MPDRHRKLDPEQAAFLAYLQNRQGAEVSAPELCDVVLTDPASLVDIAGECIANGEPVCFYNPDMGGFPDPESMLYWYTRDVNDIEMMGRVFSKELRRLSDQMFGLWRACAKLRESPGGQGLPSPESPGADHQPPTSPMTTTNPPRG